MINVLQTVHKNTVTLFIMKFPQKYITSSIKRQLFIPQKRIKGIYDLFYRNNNKLTLDFHVIVAYGVSILAVSDNLISNVKYKVEEFTGIEIEKINIFVEGVRVID